MKNRTASIFLVSIVLLLACNKEEGQGGRATIKGKVYAEYWDKTFSLKADSGYAADRDIYIVYGNSTSYGNRLRTSYDGSYEFDYLQKGNYKIYAYSRDSSGRAESISTGSPNYLYNPDIAVIQSIEITERKQVVEVDDIKILN